MKKTNALQTAFADQLAETGVGMTNAFVTDTEGNVIVTCEQVRDYHPMLSSSRITLVWESYVALPIVTGKIYYVRAMNNNQMLSARGKSFVSKHNWKNATHDTEWFHYEGIFDIARPEDLASAQNQDGTENGTLDLVAESDGDGE